MYVGGSEGILGSEWMGKWMNLSYSYHSPRSSIVMYSLFVMLEPSLMAHSWFLCYWRSNAQSRGYQM